MAGMIIKRKRGRGYSLRFVGQQYSACGHAIYGDTDCKAVNKITSFRGCNRRSF